MNNLIILIQQSNGKWESISIDDLLTLIAQKKLPISSDNGMSDVQNPTDDRMKLEEPTNDLVHNFTSEREHNCITYKYLEHIIKACEYVQKDCLKHMKSGKSCSECFYWCDKGSEEYHNCIFRRAGLGHPDTWN